VSLTTGIPIVAVSKYNAANTYRNVRLVLVTQYEQDETAIDKLRIRISCCFPGTHKILEEGVLARAPSRVSAFHW
jgi:hypothetical protein